MKVCFVLNSHWSASMGGAEYQASLLHKALETEPDVELHYLCRNSKTKDTHVEVVKSESFFSKYAYFLDAKNLYTALKRLNPDVVYHRNAGAYTGVCAYYCLKYEKRFVWNLAHDKDVTPTRLSEIKNPFKFLDKLLLEFGLKHRQVLIAQTTEQQALLKKHYNITDSILIPNYHPTPELNRMSERVKQVIWVANLKPIKRPEIFIALAKAFKNSDKVRFVMVGKSDPRYLNELGIDQIKQENFEYKGSLPQSEVNELIGSSDLFVNTSVSEGFPNTFIQSWLRETPVMSMCIDPSKIISKEGVGVVAPDIKSMTEAVKKMLLDSSAFVHMGSKAVSYAREHHSLNNIGKVKRLLGIGI